MDLKATKKKDFIFDTQITTHAIYLTRSDASKILNDAAAFFEMQQFVFSYYGLDKICLIYDVYNIESAVLGARIKYFARDLPAVDINEPFLKEKSDIGKIKNVDFECNSRARFVLDLIEIYKERCGKDFKPRFCAPFSLAANLRGYNQLVNDIYDDKKFIRELFTVINHELLAPWITRQRQQAGDSGIIASGADAWVSIPNVNLEIIEEVIIPSYNELESLVGNIYLSLLGGARFLKNPVDYLILQKVLNPFLVKGTDPDLEILGPSFYRDFADNNEINLLFGIEANFILKQDIATIRKRLENYIKIGLSAKKEFILYFNDIPSVMPSGKLKEIFSMVREIKNNN